MRPWVVQKFGGTSVASVERWRTIAGQARRVWRDGERPLVVCSAVAGVTDLLERIASAPVSGDTQGALAELRDLHARLAGALGVDLDDACGDTLATLDRLAAGVQLVGEVSARTRARIIATGELLSTKLGHAFLTAAGLDVGWVDARAVLVALPDASGSPRRWLAAACADDPDPDVRAALGGLDHAILLTQGFIARTPDGDTALLGRGGSDTSAAYFAAKLGAVRCEIWTDVPGMFTADPHVLPDARLLRRLDYSEAQEVASTGAKVLHPRAIAPLRRHGIPLAIRCAPAPSLEHTTISSLPNNAVPQVKALSSKRGVTLVSMESAGMWQEVGFLAGAFQIFSAHGLSIDLVSTSETNVSVTLDPAANRLDDAALEALALDLERVCRVRIARDVASVSVVGIGIRSILHRLSRVFDVFQEQPVHLVTQAASDLNLSIVLDPEAERRVLERLHTELFDGLEANATFGPSWRALFQAEPTPAGPRPRARWWTDARAELLEVAAQGTPVYAYHRPTIAAHAAALRALSTPDRVFYAMKANAHPEVLATIADRGVGFECVSPGEVARARAVLGEGAPGRILFTPNFAPAADYREGYAQGAFVTVDNLHPLTHWPDLFRDRDVLARIDPGVGRGHHDHVKTAGAASKFGIEPAQIPALRAAIAAAGARLIGLHAHAGSGIHTPDAWRDVAVRLAALASEIPGVRILDVGGGLGVPERPTQPPLDLAAVDAALAEVRRAFPVEELWIEPGRFFVAEAGVLLATVTQIKHKDDVTWIGVDAGMNTLIRPVLYGAWHEIVNLTRLDEVPSRTAHIVGPICESGDVLGRARRLPQTREGDVLLVAVAGAYGRAMASEYTLRGLPREAVIG